MRTPRATGNAMRTENTVPNEIERTNYEARIHAPRFLCAPARQAHAGGVPACGACLAAALACNALLFALAGPARFGTDGVAVRITTPSRPEERQLEPSDFQPAIAMWSPRSQPRHIKRRHEGENIAIESPV